MHADQNLANPAGQADDAPESRPMHDPEWARAPIYGLCILATIWALSFFDNTALSILLPLMKADLHLSDAQIGWMAGTTSVVSYALFSVPVGRMADLHSRRIIVGAGVVLGSATMLLTGFATNIWQLAAARFVMGAAQTTNGPPLMSTVADMCGRRQRAMAFAIVTAGGGLTGLTFVPLAGVMGQSLGWRPVYWVAGVAGLILAAIFVQTVPEPPRDRSGSRPADSPPVPFRAAARFLSSQRAYLAMLVFAATFMTMGTGIMIWSATFLVRVHHLSVSQAAELLGPVDGALTLIGTLFGGSVAARLYRVDTRWRIWLPTLTCGLLCPSLYLFLYGHDSLLAMTGRALYSIAFAMLLPTTYAVLVDLIPAEIRAVGVAIYMLAMTVVGQLVGPALIGVLNDRLATLQGEMAIRYSMTTMATFALVSTLALLFASSCFTKDSARAIHPLR